MIDELVKHLKREEGWRSQAYLDTEGYLTIGYGFLIDRKKGGGLPQDIGEAWLHKLAFSTWCDVTAKIPWILEQPDEVQVAIASMAYQMGVRGVLRFRMMLTALENGDRKLAATYALQSKWASQTPERAARVAEMIRGTHDNT